MLSAIVAVSNNGVIGNSGDLPWYLPADLRRFKQITTGHTVIMGRKTYDSIVARLGHGLPERQNVVVTRATDATYPDAFVTHAINEALQVSTDDDPIIIGGAQIYELAAPLVDRWYITEIDTTIDGDVILKGFNKDDFEEIARENHPADAKNPYNYSFVIYERR